jgi:aryl-alcohol dehydrogenase-like predicted oxidoreductase
VSSVLTGASRPEQVADNLGAVALKNSALLAGVLAEIDTLLNGPIPAANAAR